MGKSCRRPLHAGRRPLRVLVRGRRRPLLLLVLRSPNAPCCAAACAHGGSHSMSRVLRACMELRVSPARHGSGHMHPTSSPPVVQPDNHMPRSFTARRTSMNACEANVVEALLHAGATRTTGTLLSRLAVPCHSRRGHGEDGVMVAPQSLGALAERPLLRCCAQHVARAWSSEFRPRGTAAGICTRRLASCGTECVAGRVRTEGWGAQLAGRACTAHAASTMDTRACLQHANATHR